jgi:hypothetical protein
VNAKSNNAEILNRLESLEAENADLLKCLKDIIGACDRCVQSDDVSLIDEFTDEIEQAAREAILRAEARRQPVTPEAPPVARQKKVRLDIFGDPIREEIKCKHCGKTKSNHLARTYNCPISGSSRSFPSFGKEVFEPKESKRKGKAAVIGDPLPPTPHVCGVPGDYWGTCPSCEAIAKRRSSGKGTL